MDAYETMLEEFLRRRRVKRTLSTRHIGATDDLSVTGETGAVRSGEEVTAREKLQVPLGEKRQDLPQERIKGASQSYHTRGGLGLN
ncbi:hypothetical protein J6590_096543 [Homalodisca vitripennis]|nr:hypothetical protein J6590_096543 [Homalodisca vitripennis]